MKMLGYDSFTMPYPLGPADLLHGLVRRHESQHYVMGRGHAPRQGSAPRPTPPWRGHRLPG